MEEKQKKYFEYVAWLEKQPNVIDFAKHYIKTPKHYIETHKAAQNYFDINNQESVEFVTSLFAQSYAHEDGYKFDKETEFDKGLTIDDIVGKDCVLQRTLSRVERGLKYNDDGTVTVNLWYDLRENSQN